MGVDAHEQATKVDSMVPTADLIILSPCVMGIAWSYWQILYIRSVNLEGAAKGELEEAQSGLLKENTVATMRDIAQHISEGAAAYLRIQYLGISVFLAIFSCVIYFFYATVLQNHVLGIATVFAFIIGGLTSIFSGYIGMKTAVMCNVRTAHQCWTSGVEAGFAVSVRGGSIMGFSLCSLGIVMMWATIKVFEYTKFGDTMSIYEALAGFGLGGSTVALFGRVGGGIYTKAADVGADLSGKNEYGMDEDDPRNPACIADNVGDNVGDIAGMGADLFGSFAESTCAALIIAAKTYDTESGLANGNYMGLTFPIAISSIGILVGIVTMMAILTVPFFRVTSIEKIEPVLKYVLIGSTVGMTFAIIPAGLYMLPAEFYLSKDHASVTPWDCIIPILLGLWAGLFIGLVTEYYTSHSYRPVQEISETQRVSAATGIIYGLALGYLSCVIPIFCLVVTIIVSHALSGMYGVALAALGMLGTLTLGLTIDAYGPISDNAGGIAEMSGLGPQTRELTDALDAAGNTTAAIGKGFAIGSAALVSLALFGAFKVRAGIDTVDVSEPMCFGGLLIGAMLPYAFSAMTMKSVGTAANDMVAECMRQFPLIVNENKKPDYDTCIDISTRASLKEMIAPACLVIFSPLVVGLVFGKHAVAGLLMGILVSGVQLAISMANTGGAWDNAKKYIEAGGLGPDHAKGSSTHKNAVTGDTVGDPLKDTSGPAINILVKLSAIISLVFADVFARATPLFSV